jgi:hypothetical protein
MRIYTHKFNNTLLKTEFESNMYKCQYAKNMEADALSRPKFVHEPLTFEELMALYSSGQAQ